MCPGADTGGRGSGGLTQGGGAGRSSGPTEGTQAPDCLEEAPKLRRNSWDAVGDQVGGAGGILTGPVAVGGHGGLGGRAALGSTGMFDVPGLCSDS